MDSQQSLLNDLTARIQHHLEFIYQDILTVEEIENLSHELVEIMRFDQHLCQTSPHQNHWDEKDLTLICYGDSVIEKGKQPLKTMQQFLDRYLSSLVSNVHILPFFPYSSDDGFAVKDFYSVDQALGDWQDIEAIASKYKVMADIVINHCSSESQWFKNFIKGEGKGSDYFISMPENSLLSQVVRPRTSPLLKAVETSKGTEHVWCTFSHDQIDLDFSNPEVLKEFVKIIRFYLDNGICIFRLDAIAFIWKKINTNCLNLPETHEIVRLLRTLIEHARADSVIITETNIPNRENLSYFGNANEAHMIYNFSLPPLLLNTMVTGNCTYLKQWLMSMPPAQNGTAYFNFIASHDGIGLRPAEGLLSDEEIASLINTMKRFGGEISWRTTAEGIKSPYEINISLFDALQGTTQGPDQLGIDRFLCANAIMLGLEGVPALYIHSFLATHNDYEKCQQEQSNRAINRHKWNYAQLIESLSTQESEHAQVYNQLKQLISIRTAQPAFHPNATQFTLHLNEQLFGYWRQSIDRKQSIFCIYNISDSVQSFKLKDLNLIITDSWRDLISAQEFEDHHQELEMAPYQILWISNY